MLEKDLEIKNTDKQRRKLVDYYNQCREERFGEKGYFKYTMRFDEVHLCSKKMGFIEWLVDKDKIDNGKFYDKNILKGFMTLTKEEKADSIIMNLSIQDNPIDFLCSVLI